MSQFEPFLTAHWKEEQSHTLEYYLKQGGYQAAKKAYGMEPEAVIEEVKASGLRGRGGAGFPTGMKWGFVPKETGKPVYLACNADESEPGTFKDRYIIEHTPHLLLEGIQIACHAIGSNTAFIYIRGEFPEEARILEKAIAEAEDKKLLGKNAMGSGDDVIINVVRGAGAYICGEETGMLTSVEGFRGNPKLKPPFPAVSGLFQSPTIVNNVETLANLPFILERGASWHKSMGTEKSPGSKLFCLHGHITKPGIYELPLGTPLMELIEGIGGGVWKERTLKAVIPGGSSAPVLAAEHCRINLDYESIQEAGSMLGSGGVTVMDDQTDMVWALYNLIRFYHHESCGQCTPCREGLGWLEKIMKRIYHGEGRVDDLDLIEDICKNMLGRTICVLADAAVFPTRSFIANFRAEFEARIAH
jgi:NADH-quinone oxidoreductase subunit F